MIANRELILDFKALGEKGGKGSKEANDLLYPTVAAGDPKARERMIEMNMALVIAKVDAYVRVFPQVAHLRDDLISEGFVGLTTAVNKMAESRQNQPNPTGYMSYWINGCIGRFVDEESGIGSSSTHRNARTAGKPMPQREDEAVLRQHDDSGIDPRDMAELRDEIDACCETDEDRLIVDLREKGYTDREIATQLELPYTTTYMMRREIYARFLERTGLEGEA